MTENQTPLLQVKDLVAGYGGSRVLQGVSFDVYREPLGMIGRNGMGKSTLAAVLAGMLPTESGQILMDGKEITGYAPNRVVKSGIAYVPQGRRIFPSLTVHEHLTMVGAKSSDRWNPNTVYDLFPRLAERKKNGGGELSGGEQQMLAIGRALLTNPKLLLMDEPSEGLAPAIIEHLADVFRQLVSEGLAVLLIEQNIHFALELCDRILIMVNGYIATEVTSEELSKNTELQERFLSVV
ncbi:MAG: ABC transporter ATP-binding protein [Microbacteriaceae bacterium]|nr:ABC transporter ATP-binding protein [Microbacteriaceae bacterium]